MSIVQNPQRQYEISTPFGFQTFSGIQKIKKTSSVELSFVQKNIPLFKCSSEHPLRTPEGNIIKAGDLIEGDILEHESLGFVELKSIKFIEGEIELFDILDSGRERLFYSNGLVSHNCEFIGSSNTLISGDRLNAMVWNAPIQQYRLRYSRFKDGTQALLDIHELPIPGHVYVLCADVAGGKELDFSALCIIDITEMPYKVVAKYFSDKISTMLYPDIIEESATLYNMAFVLVETNDNDCAKTLQNDLEYENIITTTIKAKGTQVGGGFTKNVEFGLRTNKATKKIGCANLKTLLENEKLIVTDYHIFLELNSFISNSKASYSAEDGKHDDLVMCLVNFSWLVTQKYFKDLTDSDVYTQLKKDMDSALEENISFFGIISGTDDDYPDDGFKL